VAVEREGVEFCLLGPLEARRNGEPVPLGGAKQRALLARLLVDAPAVVSVDTLIDDLWGEQPPDGALHTVQVFISRLRKVLGPEALVTQAPGYLVVGDVDVERFRQLVARARERREDGRLEAAASQLGEALALWRGPALAEFAYEAFAASHI
jgi:DNA-binding SARP family transcriptional activator